MPPIRLGTRASALALTQSGTIADALRALGIPVELVTVRTLGDRRPPDTTWGEGAFVGALETALLEGEVDLAVHSAKDLPTTEDPRLAIVAYPQRLDPRDALVGREPGLTLDRLLVASRVGTDSPRRSAFLRARRPDLRVHPLHGNVDTRLRRLDAGETDALILAVAGLTRMGLAGRIGTILPPDVVPPAPGQGALAVQCRADDDLTRWWVSQLDDPATRAAVETERAFLRASGGGCRAPIGGLAHIEGDQIVLVGGSARIEALDDRAPASDRPTIAWGDARGPVADRVAIAAGLAVRLNRELGATVPATTRIGAPRVLVTRAANQAGALVEALTRAGIDVVAIPAIELQPVAAAGPLDEAAGRLDRYAWVIVTSANGAEAVLAAASRVGADPSGTRFAAVGSSTTAALAARAVPIAFRPPRSSGDGIADEIPLRPGDRILLARTDIADGRLPGRLRERGAVVDEVVAYRTVEAPGASREPLAQAFAAGPFDALVFTSGSTVRGLLRLLTPQQRRVALRSVACCIGPTTARVARECGFGRIAEAPMQSAAALAEIVVAAVLPEAPARDAVVASHEVTR
jgi:hydroxymethylbilane synthase